MLLALDRSHIAWFAAPPRLRSAMFSWSADAAQRRAGASKDKAPSGARADSTAPRPPNQADLDQFKRLMLPHLDAAYSFARFLTRGDSAAEDVVQDAFIRALRAFPNFRGGDAKAWLFAIVRNCFLSRVRARPAQAATAMQELTEAHAERIASNAETPEAALIRGEENTRLRRLLEDLPAPLCEVLVLREIEEMSYREIAIAIDAPIGTVMSRLARAREALAAAWRAGEAS